jgi:hypothetical protein
MIDLDDLPPPPPPAIAPPLVDTLAETVEQRQAAVDAEWKALGPFERAPLPHGWWVCRRCGDVSRAAGNCCEPAPDFIKHIAADFRRFCNLHKDSETTERLATFLKIHYRNYQDFKELVWTRLQGPSIPGTKDKAKK